MVSVRAPESATGAAIVLDPAAAADRRTLAGLHADPYIEFIDQTVVQAEALRRLTPPPGPELTAEPRCWVYYPWRRSVVRLLGPRAFRRVRLDRNRNLITAEEQDRLGSLRIGVVGLSVGHLIAHTAVTQGLGGQLRLADFDDLGLSNLNRVPATVFDLGVNKATVTARRIAEVDPYLDVLTYPGGLGADGLGRFLDGLDIVIEECDSLDMKALLRREARIRGLPVLMATSDRGLIDVERFDLEPERPLFHGLLGELDIAALAGLTNREKIPHVLRLVDATSLSARAAASLVEVGQTLSTWPQLAGDVAVGAAAVAEAVRRIGLGERLPSGRIRIDVAAALDGLHDPCCRTNLPTAPASPAVPEPTVRPIGVVDAVAAAARRAPSGGNAQPWHISAGPDAVIIELAPEHSSTMDVACRASAVAVGAAAFNAQVAAAASGVVGQLHYDDATSLLRATVRFVDGNAPELAELYPAMLKRETNRHIGAAAQLSGPIRRLLETTAERNGARLRLITDDDAIAAAGRVLGAADRIRYLTPQLHAEMAGELRWPGWDSVATGIDVRSLELGDGGLVTLDILRRSDVMATLAAWDGGAALSADIVTRVITGGALGVVTVTGTSLSDYARGGAAVEAVWIVAQQHGLAVQPVSPVFLYAHTAEERRVLSPGFADELDDLFAEFHMVAGTGSGDRAVLLLKFAIAPPPSVRSRRRNPELG